MSAMPDDESSLGFDAALLALVAESTGVIIIVWELEDDLVYLSQPWTLLTRGESGPSYLHLQEFRALVHPDDLMAMEAAVKLCLRGEIDEARSALRIRDRFGIWHRFLLHGRTVDREADGEARRFAASLVDVSEPISDSAPSLVGDEHYRACFEQVLNGMLLATPQGVILRANPAACSMTGYSEAELITLGRSGLMDDSDGSASRFLRQRRFLGQSRGEVRLLRKDGSRLDVEMSSILFRDSEGHRRTVVTLSPISQAREAELSLRRVSRMLAVRQRCSSAIMRATNRTALLEQVCQILTETLDLGLVWVGNADSTTMKVVPVARHGAQVGFLDETWFSADERAEEGQGPVGDAVRLRQPRVANHFMRQPGTCPWRDGARLHGLLAWAAFPLTHDETQTGVLVLHAREVGFFDEAMIELLAALSDEVVFGLDNVRREQALAESEARFRTLWESAVDAIVILDLHGVIHYANPALTVHFGHRLEDVIGRPFSLLTPERQSLAHERALKTHASRSSFARQWRSVVGLGVRKDGTRLPIEITFSDTHLDGEPRVVVQMRDVTERKRVELATRRQNQVLRRIAEGAALAATLEAIAKMAEAEVRCRAAILIPESLGQGDVLLVAPSFGPFEHVLLRRTAQEFLDQTAHREVAEVIPRCDHLRPDASCEACEAMVSAGSVDEPNAAQNAAHSGVTCLPLLGRAERLVGVLVCSHENRPMRSAQRLSLATYAELATLALESHRADERIRRLAHHDELTGLANRSGLLAMLEQSIARARRNRGQVGLLVVDLDRFKQVNHVVGPLVGDEILRVVAERLKEAVRKSDLVARWDGDEFVIVIEQLRQSESLVWVADKVLRAVGRPIEGGGAAALPQLTASIGICSWPVDGVDAAGLLKGAVAAMLRARDSGGNDYCFAEPLPAPPSLVAQDGKEDGEEDG